MPALAAALACAAVAILPELLMVRERAFRQGLAPVGGDARADYLWVGQFERALGVKLAGAPVFESGTVAIYRVPGLGPGPR